MKVINLKDKITSVLPMQMPETDFPWYLDYSENYQKYDKFFFRSYGSKNLIVDAATAEEWHDEVRGVLYLYKEELEHFWEVNIAEYSPVDNVFETRTEITNRDAHTDTATNGAQTNDDTYGARTDTDNTGTNGKTGNTTSTNVTSQVPYDSTIEKETGKDVTTVLNEELETNRTKGAQTDTHTIGERTDTLKTGAQHEELKVDRHGNIGTTLSTDIMQGSIDFWDKYNFYIELYALLNKELLEGEWG